MSGGENKTLNGQKRQNWTHLKLFQKGVKKRHERHLSKLPHRQPPLNTTPLNPPVSVEETLSWLQVPLWYMPCWPFPDHMGWLYACWAAVWQDLHKGFTVIAFLLFQAIHSAMTHITLCSPEKVGWYSAETHTHTHTAIQQSSLQARCTRQTWVMWQPRRETTPGGIFLFLLFYY